MSRGAAAAVFLIAAASLAMAATNAQSAARARPRVFISPFGEPFRPSAAMPDPFDAWFDKVATGHDGRIDRDQFRADAAAFFRRLDLDGDGVIDGFEIANYETRIAPELAASAEAHAVATSSDAPAMLITDPEPVESADLALDSRITLAEWLQVADTRFNLLDRKHQGYLGRGDLIALLPKDARPAGGAR